VVVRNRSAADEFLMLEDAVLVAQCEIDNYRASGPGGQKRNKTSSAVRLRHRPTGLSVTATEERSQHVNKARGIRRLREAIALQVRSEIVPEAYKPSELLTSCIGRDGQLQIGRRDVLYYPIVSEVLDLLAAYETRVRDTAKHLGLSTAHLTKFIRNDPKLWKRVNEMRTGKGAKPLR